MPLLTGLSLEKQLPPDLLDRKSERWVSNGAGGKVLAEYTLRGELRGRSLIVFLPGANTDTCTNHLPILVAGIPELNAMSVKVHVVAVNRTDDLYAWAKQYDPESLVNLIPDMDAEFTLAVGVAAWSGRLGMMANRVAVITDADGVVLDIVPEVDESNAQKNRQCVLTGTNIVEKVKTLFADNEAKKARS